LESLGGLILAVKAEASLPFVKLRAGRTQKIWEKFRKVLIFLDNKWEQAYL